MLLPTVIIGEYLFLIDDEEMKHSAKEGGAYGASTGNKKPGVFTFLFFI